MGIKTYGAKRNFLAIGQEHSSLDSARIAILPAPYEHTVSYGGGTGRGPRGILDASAYVEFYDDEFERELCFEAGIATIRALELDGIVDHAALAAIQRAVAQLIGAGKFVVTLGGEHTISTAPILAHLEAYPAMTLLHFDAHSDLRDSYEGSRYSHASFAARVAEVLPPQRITQVGIRAQCIEEALFIKERKVNTFYANAIRRGVHGEDWQRAVVDTLGEEVYITFDVDFFDPSIMPSTGTPEPDGFLYAETLDLLRYVRLSGRRIIGLDVVELAPVKGVTHPDILTARLIYKILNIAFAETMPSYPRLERWLEASNRVAGPDNGRSATKSA
jgi:agmatinase